MQLAVQLITFVAGCRRRVDMHANWQMPQGGIDPAEDPMDAALRELREETGIQNVKIVAAVRRAASCSFLVSCRQGQASGLEGHGEQLERPVLASNKACL